MKTSAKQLAAARRAMEVIAAREGISVEEVRRENQPCHPHGAAKGCRYRLRDSVRRCGPDAGGIDRLLCFEVVSRKTGRTAVWLSARLRLSCCPNQGLRFQ